MLQIPRTPWLSMMGGIIMPPLPNIDDWGRGDFFVMMVLVLEMVVVVWWWQWWRRRRWWRWRL